MAFLLNMYLCPLLKLSRLKSAQQLECIKCDGALESTKFYSATQYVHAITVAWE